MAITHLNRSTFVTVFHGTIIFDWLLILGYRWQDRVSNQEVLSRAGMSRVTCLIRERQLRFYGHVVRFPMDDPAHRILNAKDPVEWNRRRGRPNSSWLAHLGDHMKE